MTECACSTSHDCLLHARYLFPVIHSGWVREDWVICCWEAMHRETLFCTESCRSCCQADPFLRIQSSMGRFYKLETAMENPWPTRNIFATCPATHVSQNQQHWPGRQSSVKLTCETCTWELGCLYQLFGICLSLFREEVKVISELGNNHQPFHNNKFQQSKSSIIVCFVCVWQDMSS